MATQRLDMIDYTTEIPVPVESVYARFADVPGWSGWIGPIRRSRVLGRGGLREGAWVEFVTDLFPMEIPLRARIVRFVPGRLVEWGIVTPLGRVIHRFEFTADGKDRCKVSHVEFAEGVFSALLRPLAKKIEEFDRRWADDMAAAFCKKNAA